MFLLFILIILTPRKHNRLDVHPTEGKSSLALPTKCKFGAGINQSHTSSKKVHALNWLSLVVKWQRWTRYSFCRVLQVGSNFSEILIYGEMLFLDGAIYSNKKGEKKVNNIRALYIRFHIKKKFFK